MRLAKGPWKDTDLAKVWKTINDGMGSVSIAFTDFRGYMQTSTESTASAITDITQTIGRVNEISTTISAAVEEQGAATQEISRSIQNASTGTNEVFTNIVGVNQASQQTSAGATQVLSAASELAKNSDSLKKEVDNFLKSVQNL